MNPIRTAIIGSALVLTAAGGAAGIAFSGSASAADDAAASSVTAVAVDDSVTTDAATTDAATTDAPAPKGPHSANGITEEVLTGDAAASVQAAVAAALPDATIDRMETDAEGAAYEAHVTLADGSDATVKLDASFAITETIQGHG